MYYTSRDSCLFFCDELGMGGAAIAQLFGPMKRNEKIIPAGSHIDSYLSSGFLDYFSPSSGSVLRS